jgi:hypothetical protein
MDVRQIFSFRQLTPERHYRPIVDYNGISRIFPDSKFLIPWKIVCQQIESFVTTRIARSVLARDEIERMPEARIGRF